ncbi:MAG: diguanylate cyclase [Nodosilinea sp.]
MDLPDSIHPLSIAGTPLAVDPHPLRMAANFSLQQGVEAMATAAKTCALIYSGPSLLGVFTYSHLGEAATCGVDFRKALVSQWLTTLDRLHLVPGNPIPAPDDYWPLLTPAQHWVGLLTPEGDYKVTPAAFFPPPEKFYYCSPAQAKLPQEHLTLALKGAKMGVWNWDLVTNTWMLSEELEQLLAIGPGNFDGRYETILNSIYREDRASVHQVLQTAISHGQRYDMDFRVLQQDGQVRWLLSQGQVFNHNTLPTRLVGITLDISQQKQAESELKLQAQQERLVGQIAQRIRSLLDLDNILEQTVILVREFVEADRVIILRCTPDVSGKVVQEACVDSYPTMLGWSLRDPWTVQEKFLAHYRRGRGLAIANIYEQGLAESQLLFLEYFKIQAEMLVPLLQGQTLWGLLIVHQCSHPRQWRNSDLKLLQTLATQVGIAIHQAKLHQRLTLMNQQLKRMAYLDGLTQVANRRRFEHHLEQEWRRMTRQGTSLSIILADIDYFKQFNDLYGHQAGDQCLRLVARILGRAVKRSGDLVARYGGEEFVVILPNTDLTGAEAVAENIRQSIRNRRITHLGKSTIDGIVTLSLGVASCRPGYGIDTASLLKQADGALYAAKHGGRDQVRLADNLESMAQG